MRRNLDRPWRVNKRTRPGEDQDEWTSQEDPLQVRRLNEGLLDLWERPHAEDCESSRARAITDIVGEPV